MSQFGSDQWPPDVYCHHHHHHCHHRKCFVVAWWNGNFTFFNHWRVRRWIYSFRKAWKVDHTVWFFFCYFFALSASHCGVFVELSNNEISNSDRLAKFFFINNVDIYLKICLYRPLVMEMVNQGIIAHEPWPISDKKFLCLRKPQRPRVHLESPRPSFGEFPLRFKGLKRSPFYLNECVESSA